MLPIKQAIIVYSDGSTYTTPDDGTWAEAPPFGVYAVVYYHAPRGVTRADNQEIYYHIDQEAGGKEWKMGLWTDGENYWRLHDLVKKLVTP